MGLRDGTNDRQAQPASLVAFAAGPTATETLEDPRLLVAGIHARAGVAHPEMGLGPVHARADGDLIPVLGVFDGVVGEAGQRLRHALAIGDDAAWARRVHGPLAVGHAAHLADQLIQKRIQVHCLELQEIGTLRTGQQREVFDETAHPVELVGHELDGRPALGGILGVLLGEQLEVSAHDRDRSAEVMAHVAHELSLARECIRQSIEHPVEGRRQLGELVVTANLDPSRQLGARDRAGGVPQLTDRRQHPPGDQKRECRAEQEDDRGDSRDDSDRLLDLRHLALHEDRHDESPDGSVALPHRHGDVARFADRRLELSALGLVEVASTCRGAAGRRSGDPRRAPRSDSAAVRDAGSRRAPRPHRGRFAPGRGERASAACRGAARPSQGPLPRRRASRTRRPPARGCPARGRRAGPAGPGVRRIPRSRPPAARSTTYEISSRVRTPPRSRWNEERRPPVPSRPSSFSVVAGIVLEVVVVIILARRRRDRLGSGRRCGSGLGSW